MQLLDAFYRDMVHFILIMMSLPGPPTRAGFFDNPGCDVWQESIERIDFNSMTKGTLFHDKTCHMVLIYVDRQANSKMGVIINIRGEYYMFKE